jgi:uncharacterized membrane protein (DUF4010 family)
MQIGPALLAAAVIAVAFGLFSAFWQRPAATDQPAVEFRNPFGFWSVIGFAVFLGAIIVLGRALGQSFGAAGAIAGAIVVGFGDIDSVTISMSRLTPETLALEHAGYAILAAVASNTMSKIAIGAVIGRGRFAAEIAVMALLCIAAGGATLALTLTLLTAKS